VRLLSLLILVVFTLGGVRPAWSCPSQVEKASCCCPQADAPPAGETQLAPVCCCEAKPATPGTTSTPTVAAPSAERVVLGPAIPVATLLPPLVIVERTLAIDVELDKVPPRTLLSLRTLLLC
jgi:hypothetical protein